MLFTTEFLAKLFTNNRGAVEDQLPIQEISTDSRKKSTKSLFIPLTGETFDGHQFIEDAFYNGAVATLWEKDKQLPSFLPTDFPIFFVEDTLEALQQLAHHYRQKVNPVVIGITGSNGKTTTKDLVGTVLQTNFKTHRTNGNYNNQIGLPLTILSMPTDTEVLVLEMGMDHFGEIERLSTLSCPNYAVITNIGESHIEYLGSREGIAQAKSEILAGLQENGLLLIDGDERLLKGLHTYPYVSTVGFSEENDFNISYVEMTADQTLFELDHENYQLNMLGNHNVKNATFAVVIAKKLGVPLGKIKDALVHLELTGMRFEITKGQNNVTIINDAYNASPTSMKASIDIVKQMKGYQSKVLVLGDMYELGSSSKVLHRSVAEAISEKIDVVYTVGSDSEEITKAIRESSVHTSAKHFDNKQTLIEELQAYLSEDVLIMLKASRGMKLESLLDHIT
ncbi:UDP-N-acetylmuramoyl-tripeptide--D-alanyl-D-alanine ligase [Aquibacillus sediminis]|uniref:UDP-N-acetylmuramoyl-tripeptide--D-alanyl-D- alanine ligase n=1 Tax=Aquibacillus sediminis TaxID=2574734 RepID=UPI001107FC31|nr:UDP-N-acetylmuramoyl-tripeptide--D-alanyl-D-alanine ligase [Aquibacillus sediminis]